MKKCKSKKTIQSRYNGRRFAKRAQRSRPCPKINGPTPVLRQEGQGHRLTEPPVGQDQQGRNGCSMEYRRPQDNRVLPHLEGQSFDLVGNP